ncbi:hypothetical protein [Gemmatimonas sp.]|uniref:hypothetical protein n=1 Tax=Gemmatimonas sp. TaxID=1962908 RepID=UPI003983A331
MKAGDLDGPFRDLDRAYNAHAIWMVGLSLNFKTLTVKRDPRFKALLATMKSAEDKP